MVKSIFKTYSHYSPDSEKTFDIPKAISNLKGKINLFFENFNKQKK